MSSAVSKDRTEFEERVYGITKRIPKGKVSTYSDVAEALGDRRMARAVGNALGKNPYGHVPCYRVVRRDGGVGGYSAPGGSRSKAAKLRDDGIEIRRGVIVDLDRYLVSPDRLQGATPGPKRGSGKKGGR
jgi:methylated-DNA-[protein]-cysteine S-methyltransferase